MFRFLLALSASTVLVALLPAAFLVDTATELFLFFSPVRCTRSN